MCVDVLYRAMLVGGGETLIEARERHGKVLSDCIRSLLV
jgi:hypothetical protein